MSFHLQITETLFSAQQFSFNSITVNLFILRDLLTAMQDMEAGVRLCNHYLGDEVYKLCFSGE